MIKLFLSAFVAISLTGCASTHTKNPDDPLESFNRGVYRFNDVMDRAIAKPIALGYNTVVPTPGRTMVGNFFSNLSDIVVTANDLLQFKFVQAFSDCGRLLINTTIGAFGLVDVATQTGLEKHNEDFGQTLGFWGVGSGPYLMLPILGPSNFRDGIGIFADGQISMPWNVDHSRTRNQLYFTNVINHRSQLLDKEKVLDEAALDRYDFIRSTYIQYRRNLIFDGNPPREKYDDDDADTQQAPDSKAPHANPVPIKPLANPDKTTDANVHKIWVSSGYR